jgi:hypothetical protein
MPIIPKEDQGRHGNDMHAGSSHAKACGNMESNARCQVPSDVGLLYRVSWPSSRNKNQPLQFAQPGFVG